MGTKYQELGQYCYTTWRHHIAFPSKFCNEQDIFYFNVQSITKESDFPLRMALPVADLVSHPEQKSEENMSAISWPIERSESPRKKVRNKSPSYWSNKDETA